MGRLTAAGLVILGSIGLILIGAGHVQAEENPDVVAARKARDSANIESLRALITKTQNEAQKSGKAEAYARLAQFDLWLCEAGHGHNDDKVIKQAAEDGVAAAEKAVALDANSSEAHRLLGDALGELIPHAFAGGMRYGRRSTAELDKAIELDPKNANAYIGRAISYFFTPSAFGGDRDKAGEMLKKAIALDPVSDTAHIWLAQVYLSAGQREQALKEANEAKRINPERGFAKSVESQIAAATRKKTGAS
jgi:cytochrome c-type biogenesis protein CcmH/NrfG